MGIAHCLLKENTIASLKKCVALAVHLAEYDLGTSVLEESQTL